MRERLPPWLLIFLACTAGGTFVLGVFLEAQHGVRLQDHPYLTNTLSGMTGFATSALIIALGFNRVVSRHRSDAWRNAMRQTGEEFADRIYQVFEAIPTAVIRRPGLQSEIHNIFDNALGLNTYFHYLHTTDNTTLIRFEQIEYELATFARRVERLLGSAYTNLLIAFDLGANDLAFLAKVRCEASLSEILDCLDRREDMELGQLAYAVAKCLDAISLGVDWTRVENEDVKAWLQPSSVRRGTGPGPIWVGMRTQRDRW